MSQLREKIEETAKEILIYQDKLVKLRKALPKIVLVGVIFIFLYPTLPGKRGGRWIDDKDYWSGVVFGIICFLAIVPIGYGIAVYKYKKYIRQLLAYKDELERQRNV
nr:hypothetical protein [Allomuricauda sp.]